MSTLGRPKGEYRRAEHEGRRNILTPGRPKGEYRRAQHEGGPKKLRRAALYGAAAVALAAVFVAYLNPDLAFDLANRVWACFQ